MIELSEMIRNLRRELETAIAAAPTQGLQLEVGPVELELSVGVRKEAGANGKVTFWVVELGGEGRAAHESTQVVRLTLQPKMVATGRAPHVAGRGRPGE
ncbi:trypco2 family protein [Streptomyces smyrnaeus]|uniref:trypco2 family protein n=1 Tax=Streptomyces TaxID=1883 RepID=UPI000C1796E0|nr:MULTISPECIES: trypco2 family protein [unclassified Streptomyces]MBQ0862202.1 hypothetical protein [Streptomyces sp. RK75]MBQ1125355.1 hypothetical protein [Streptomyces sp. B15]MBQ1157657.1 hypothetical protein [Streptomyces sp. A73]